MFELWDSRLKVSFRCPAGLVGNLGKLVLKNVQQVSFDEPLYVYNKFRKSCFLWLILDIVCQGASTTCYVALHPQVKGVSGEYFSDNNIAKTTSMAKDSDLSRRLWEFSTNMVKSKIGDS